MNEIWKDVTISKFKPYYQVSNTGKVRNKHTNRFLKQFKDNRGYLKVAMSLAGHRKKNTSVSVHRLVALTYIPNEDPYIKTTVNHKDYDKTHNSVDNLEWMSNSDNVKDAYKTNHHIMGKGVSANSSKYTEKQVRDVCKLLEKGETPKHITTLTGIPENVVGHIKARKIWTSVSEDYNFELPKKRNIYEDMYDDIDDLIYKGYDWKEIRSKLHLPKSKPIRDLLFRRIKKATTSSSTTIENRTNDNLIIRFDK